MAGNFQFEQFGQERAAFEVRFATALLHWDQAGATWLEFLGSYPNFTMSQAEAGKTVFSFDDRFQCTFTLTSALVLASYPNRDELKEFTDIADKFMSIFFRSLRISELTRVGLRCSYFWESKSKAEASKSLLKTGLVGEPNVTGFGIEGEFLFPKYGVRYEGKSLGVNIRMEAQEKTVGVEAAFGTKAFEPGFKRFKPVKYVEAGVALDIDLYTTAPIPIGAFPTGEWINQSFSKIKHGATSLFNR